jgi:chromosome segregation ATPase
VIATLFGGVLKLYHQQITDYKSRDSENTAEINELKKAVRECETDRTQIKLEHAEMKERLRWVEKDVEKLKQCNTGNT